MSSEMLMLVFAARRREDQIARLKSLLALVTLRAIRLFAGKPGESQRLVKKGTADDKALSLRNRDEYNDSEQESQIHGKIDHARVRESICSQSHY